MFVCKEGGRLTVCKRLLHTADRELPLTALKVKHMFACEVQYAVRSNGKLPTTLWLLMSTVCCAWKTETQDIEWINSLIKDSAWDDRNAPQTLAQVHPPTLVQDRLMRASCSTVTPEKHLLGTEPTL